MRSTAKLAAWALIAIAVAGACGFSACAQKSPSFPTRVLVFGIDGGTWSVIDEMFAAGELPTLKKLCDHGIRGVLESRPPALSPVVWSTIFTGRPWQEHGVKDWKTSQSTHRKVKALWEITSSYGLVTTVLNVPSSWPPTPVNGSLISGFPLSGSTVGGNTGEVVKRGGLHEPGVTPNYTFNDKVLEARMEALKVGEWSDWIPLEIRGRPQWRALTRIYRFEEDKYYLTPIYRVDQDLVITYPRELHAEIDLELGGDPYIPEGPGWSLHAQDDTPKYLYSHLLQIAQIQSRTAVMLAKRPWDVFIDVDTLVDRVSHPYWAYMHPDDYDGLDRAKAARYADAVRNAYRETDKQLAAVLDAVEGDDYWVMIVSDHGFHSNEDEKSFIGTHEFDGIYVVSGPGMKPTPGSRAYIEDVAPTVLYLLDKPVASDMSGRVISDVAAAVQRPIGQIASYEGGDEKRGTNEPVDQKTWDQLKGLGYVDADAPRVAPAPPKSGAMKPPPIKKGQRPPTSKPNLGQ